jgi:RimJ/RimL family protein N-acetyltransferase
MSAGANSTALESLVINDLDSLIRLWTEPSVRTYLGGVLAPEQAQARAETVIADVGNAWAIRNRIVHGQRLLGLVTFGTHCDLKTLEISYLLLPEYRGHGYASVAVASGSTNASVSAQVSRFTR